MRLKYQLRGLGIGIILGVLLMGVFTGTKEETLTDDQIKARAKALGMEEARVLSELPETSSETEEVSSVNVEESSVTEQVSSTTEQVSSTTETIIASTEEIKDSETNKETILHKEVGTMDQEVGTMDQEIASMDQAVVPEEKMVIITIRSGDGSGTVSSKLEQAGLIKDASAYDKYLCNNGYDKKIRVGNHEIPYGATEEEIAKNISSR